MATKKQNKHIRVRKLRASLKQSGADITRVGRGIHKVGYGSGASRRAFGKAGDQE